MKRTALLAAILSALATPALAHPAVPEGHIHGLEMQTIAGAAPYFIGFVAVALLLYVAKRAAKT